MGVFTTQTLLNSVGASRNSSASAAVAINWILKVSVSSCWFCFNKRTWLYLIAEYLFRMVLGVLGKCFLRVRERNLIMI